MQRMKKQLRNGIVFLTLGLMGSVLAADLPRSLSDIGDSTASNDAQASASFSAHEKSSTYSSEYASGFSGPAALHLPVPRSPRNEHNVGQAPRNALPVVQEQRIEIVIRNSEFMLTERVGLQFGLPTILILRNQDIIRHGFTSPILLGLVVQAEGEGIATYGKGVEGFYVDAGKTLVIRFTADRQGRYEFRCDLHPHMRGEVFLLEMSTA